VRRGSSPADADRVDVLVDALSGVLSGRYALDDLVRWGGYLVLVAIVFVETGLLIG